MEATESKQNHCAECGHIWAGDGPCTNTGYCKVGWLGHLKIEYDECRAALPKLIADLESDDGGRDDLQELVIGIKHVFYRAAELVSDDVRGPFDVAVRAWDERREVLLAKRAAEVTAASRERWRRVTVDGVDITEHIAAMFDSIVGSLDWGSGFLSTEEIESIMIVADLVGFDAPDPDPTSAPDELLDGVSQAEVFSDGHRAQTRAAWRAQVRAKAQAMRGDSK